MLRLFSFCSGPSLMSRVGCAGSEFVIEGDNYICTSCGFENTKAMLMLHQVYGLRVKMGKVSDIVDKGVRVDWLRSYCYYCRYSDVNTGIEFFLEDLKKGEEELSLMLHKFRVGSRLLKGDKLLTPEELLNEFKAL